LCYIFHKQESKIFNINAQEHSHGRPELSRPLLQQHSPARVRHQPNPDPDQQHLSHSQRQLTTAAAASQPPLQPEHGQLHRFTQQPDATESWLRLPKDQRQ